MLREKAKDRQTAAPPSWAQGRKQPWGGGGEPGEWGRGSRRLVQGHTAAKPGFGSQAGALCQLPHCIPNQLCLMSGHRGPPSLGGPPSGAPLSGRTQAGLGRCLGHGAGRAASDGQMDRQAAPGLLPTWEAIRSTAGARRTQHLSKPVYQRIPAFVFHRLTPSGFYSPLPHHLMLERL